MVDSSAETGFGGMWESIEVAYEIWLVVMSLKSVSKPIRNKASRELRV